METICLSQPCVLCLFCIHIYIFSTYIGLRYMWVWVCVYQNKALGPSGREARGGDGLELWWKRADMRGRAGGVRFRRCINRALAPERPRSNRVFEELLTLICWRLFEWFSVILYLGLMFHCHDLWNSGRCQQASWHLEPFAERLVIIARCWPRDQDHQLPHGFYCISNNAGPGLRGASRVPEVYYFFVLTADRNYL